MAQILVLHNTLNSTGGEERVCLNTIECLEEAGHEVVLGTADKTDWQRVERHFGRKVMVDGELALLPFRLGAFGIYARLMTGLIALRLRGEVDLIINTHGDVIPAPADLTYVHYPLPALMVESPETFFKYQRNLFWRLYYTPYGLLQGGSRLIFKGGLLLTNSSYSREAIWRWLRKRAVVVYPPVDVESFVFSARRKEDLVLTVSRLTPEKGLHLIPHIARRVPEAHFVIAGATQKGSAALIARLGHLCDRLGVRNVEVRPDISFTELRELYAKARILLHTRVGEHFGISVVEGMASGCVPVVHRSGGPWTDIVKNGEYGFGYDTIHEAADTIRALIASDLTEMSRRAIVRAQEFSEQRFKERMRGVVAAVLAARDKGP